MMGGLFIVISQNNLVKKLVGLAIFQTSVFIFYISVGKMAGGTAPILMDGAPAGALHQVLAQTRAQISV